MNHECVPSAGLRQRGSVTSGTLPVKETVDGFSVTREAFLQVALAWSLIL